MFGDGANKEEIKIKWRNEGKAQFRKVNAHEKDIRELTFFLYVSKDVMWSNGARGWSSISLEEIVRVLIRNLSYWTLIWEFQSNDKIKICGLSHLVYSIFL